MVFCDEAWQLCGSQAIAVNDGISYALVKHRGEYFIIAEKRIGEYVSRYTFPEDPESAFKTIMMFSGDMLT